MILVVKGSSRFDCINARRRARFRRPMERRNKEGRRNDGTKRFQLPARGRSHFGSSHDRLITTPLNAAPTAQSEANAPLSASQVTTGSGPVKIMWETWGLAIRTPQSTAPPAAAPTHTPAPII